jgi:hypothetical protein
MTNQVEFFRIPAIIEENFLATADTGDLLLFRTNNDKMFGPRLTRALTSQHFDHVALILRFGSTLDSLMVMEAVADKGVRIVPWLAVRQEVCFKGFFEKVTTRKLLTEMDQNKLEILDDFREKALGKKYSINPLNFLWCGAGPQLPQSGVGDTQTFFCSELVAEVFKNLDLLTEEGQKKTNSMYPGYFAP